MLSTLHVLGSIHQSSLAALVNEISTLKNEVNFSPYLCLHQSYSALLKH